MSTATAEEEAEEEAEAAEEEAGAVERAPSRLAAFVGFRFIKREKPVK